MNQKPALSQADAEAWTKPYNEQDELVKTARDLHSSVTDPKLKNSKVKNRIFIRFLYCQEIATLNNIV